MKTPAGKECAYFYGDYHRGRAIETCRLLDDDTYPHRWKPALCSTCPVPDILRDNTCQHQILAPKIERPFFILKPRLSVTAACTKYHCTVADPHIGCGQCHPLPFFRVGDKIEPDPPH